jgi:hypothetical protein
MNNFRTIYIMVSYKRHRRHKLKFDGGVKPERGTMAWTYGVESSDQDQETEDNEEIEDSDEYEQIRVLMSDLKFAFRQIIASRNYQGDIVVLETIAGDSTLDGDDYLSAISDIEGSVDLLKDALDQFNTTGTIRRGTITQIENIFSQAAAMVDPWGGGTKRRHRNKRKTHRRVRKSSRKGRKGRKSGKKSRKYRRDRK